MHRRRDTKREHGQILILFALSLVVILGFAALVVDLGMLKNNRQTLVNALDAGALAGGTYANVTQADSLPNVTPVTNGYVKTTTVINNTIAADYPGLPVSATPVGTRCVTGIDPIIAQCAYQITYKCMIGVNPITNQPYVSRDITAVCDPHNALGHNPLLDTPAQLATDFPGAGPTRSSACRPDLGDSCNTVIINGASTTQFGFGPAIGVKSGSSGTVSSASCRGPCGASPVVPVDLVMILDRTGSMADGNNNAGAKIQALQGAAFAVLQVYDPAKQRVGLTLTGPGKVSGTGQHQLANCQYPSNGVTAATQVYGVGDDTNLGVAAYEVPGPTTFGAWIPVGLSGTDSDVPLPFPNGVAGTYSSGGIKLITSDIVKSIACIGAYSGGTNLATPIEMAQWYLDHFGRPGVTQGIILETDGHPETHTTDIKFTCGETVRVANLAKADKTKSPNGIQIFTVGYGVDNTAKCPTTAQNAFEQPAWSGVAAPTFLQAVATDAAHFFNNPSSAQLATVFTQAATTLAKNPAQLVELYPKPVVTSISPTVGTHNGGTVVTINGRYFTGANSPGGGVGFGGVAAGNINIISDTQMTVTSPAGAIGTTVDVVVTTGGGSSLFVAGDRYTYN